MSNFNTIVVNLSIIADNLREMKKVGFCHVEEFERDKIRYESGVIVKLMNEIVNELRIDSETASEYDFKKLPYQTLVGNEIPEEELVELYDVFFKTIKSRYEERKNEYTKNISSD